MSSLSDYTMWHTGVLRLERCLQRKDRRPDFGRNRPVREFCVSQLCIALLGLRKTQRASWYIIDLTTCTSLLADF